MAYIQVGPWLGATARGYRGPRPLRRERATRECAPPSSYKLTGEKKFTHKKTRKQRVPQSRHLCMYWRQGRGPLISVRRALRGTCILVLASLEGEIMG